MSHLKKGDKAPYFQGKDQDGNTISLDDFKENKLILYFYPKDNTPGCTVQACNLRDNYNAMLNQGYAVVGVSGDSEKAHKNFIKKHNLPFPLIADTEKDIIKSYGVLGTKNIKGKPKDRILRTTFVINENGIIDEVISKVNTKDHASQIFE